MSVTFIWTTSQPPPLYINPLNLILQNTKHSFNKYNKQKHDISKTLAHYTLLVSSNTLHCFSNPYSFIKLFLKHMQNDSGPQVLQVSVPTNVTRGRSGLRPLLPTQVTNAVAKIHTHDRQIPQTQQRLIITLRRWSSPRLP